MMRYFGIIFGKKVKEKEVISILYVSMHKLNITLIFLQVGCFGLNLENQHHVDEDDKKLHINFFLDHLLLSTNFDRFFHDHISMTALKNPRFSRICGIF